MKKREDGGVMTMEEFLHSKMFLQALEEIYEEEWRRNEEKFSGEKYTFSPAFLRKMEELIGGRGKE